MYNRYIPQPDGSYQRSRVQEPKPSQQHTQTRQPPCEHQKRDCQKEDPQKGTRPEPNAPQCHNEPQRHSAPQSTNLSSFLRQFLPGNFETGDLIVVLLLLLMAGDNQENRNNALLTMALYFLM